MEIKKILNNNAVITTSKSGKEIIVMGKGLAYRKKTGDTIDETKIIKTFETGLNPNQKKLMAMIQDIPAEYMDISDKIIRKAKAELEVELDELLYVSLTDHIHTSIERYKEGYAMQNHLLMEIKHFYKKEFELGKWALDLIEKRYGIRMDEHEASFLAMHIVGSEVGRDITDVYEITNFIQEVFQIVHDFFHMEFDEQSLAYYRFVTHLKYFGKRVFLKMHTEQNEPLNNDLLGIMKLKYIQPFLCAKAIKQHIEEKYQYQLDDEEILFLTIHVAKIVSGK